ncbi:MAG: glycosyltransferase family 1 protein [Candidatus Omnitrophota bacterium]|jgi:glycosyltransferase involved in cell wall biosynthesis
MNIGLDARILANKKCGIAVYVYSLAREFVRIDESLEVFLFLDHEIDSSYLSYLDSPHIHKVIFGTAKNEKKHWAQKLLPEKLKQYKIDIYHATWNNAVPMFRSCPCVLTIHDLAPWVLGGHFKNIAKEIRFKLRHLACSHSADVIITDSEESKKDIIRLCRVRQAKIKTIYLGLEESYKSPINPDSRQEYLAEYNLKGKNYIIDTIGIDHPRRNPLLALNGFYEYLKENNYPDLFLVYTGNYLEEGKQYQDLLSRIRELDLGCKVIITGWLSDDKLKSLLSGAKISIIPSLYEGFCLPLLEAFSCEVPVIATDCGSIPEVAGNAAILIKPDDYAVLGIKIKELLQNQDFKRDLIRKGKDRLQAFSWEKSALETLGVYKHLIKAVK